MAGVLTRAGDGDLMRPPCPLDLDAVDLARARPALRRAQHEHRPARALRGRPGTRGVLDRADLVQRFVERNGEPPVRFERRLVELRGDDRGAPAVALEERAQLA